MREQIRSHLVPGPPGDAQRQTPPARSWKIHPSHRRDVPDPAFPIPCGRLELRSRDTGDILRTGLSFLDFKASFSTNINLQPWAEGPAQKLALGDFDVLQPSKKRLKSKLKLL